jgi:hypothetical protein
MPYRLIDHCFHIQLFFFAFKCYTSVLVSANTLFVSVNTAIRRYDMFAYILRALKAYLQNPNY